MVAERFHDVLEQNLKDKGHVIVRTYHLSQPLSSATTSLMPAPFAFSTTPLNYPLPSKSILFWHRGAVSSLGMRLYLLGAGRRRMYGRRRSGLTISIPFVHLPLIFRVCSPDRPPYPQLDCFSCSSYSARWFHRKCGVVAIANSFTPRI